MRLALKALLLLAILLVVGAITLPWWLGAALRPVARAQGFTFERYETVGYGRFRLIEARFERPGVAFSAARVILDTPLFWLLRRSDAQSEISDWSLRLTPVEKSRPGTDAPGAASPATVHAQVQRVTRELRNWLPRLTAESGAISRRDQTWRIAHLTWAEGTLRASVTLPTGQEVRADFTEKNDVFLIAADSPSLAVRVDLSWAPTALRGTGSWQDQPFSLEAAFDGPAWIPTRAEFRAANWDLPAAQAKLGPAYSRIHGHAQARWAQGALILDLEAAATPARNTQAPPFELIARAEGDRRQITLRELRVHAPFATATLSAPLAFSLDARAPATPAVLAITADLSQQPWFDGAGKLTGEIRATPLRGDSRGTFNATVESLRLGKLAARSAIIRGDWHGPRVNVDQLEVTLDSESRIVAHGAVDSATRVLSDARVDVALSPAWAATLLPRGIAFDKIVASAELAGPLARPRHRGELDATQLRASKSRPFNLHAQWTGEAGDLAELSASLRVPKASLRLSGALAGHRASLREFQLDRSGRTVLRSVTPSEFSWGAPWEISGLRLEGDEDRALAADVEWSETPRFFVSAHNLASEWLSDWWSGEIVPLRIATLTLQSQLRGRALGGEATIDASAQVDGTWLQARIAAAAEANGVRISQLEVADPRGLMAYASGRVPVRIAWSAGPHIEIDQGAPLELDASIAPDSPLWELVRRRSEFSVEGGSLVASLTGSLAQPRGLVRVEAARLSRGAARAEPDPAEITTLAAAIRGQRDGLQLEALTAQIAGHSIRATGRLPMNDEAWRTLVRAPGEFDWRRGEVQLSAPRVELAALAHTFPALPFTGGTLSADLQFVRGELTGRAELRGGASRPLPGLGRLLALEADLALAGRRVEVRTFSARLGGEPVELTGTAALRDRNRLDLDLRLQAKNVPLVRRPGLLVRTDLDLRAETPERGPTRISGRVELRDALVLADLAAILPGGPRGAARVPPYFSIDAEPFARWPLDVQLGGLRAVRVRTAVFNGIATPQFHLTGTLGEPRAIGQLSVDEGQVLFPFARFAVQQGAVRLTAADPTQPQLAVNATAKRMGYELRLEAGGTAAAPTLAFSSNPPLESADILLLVTTGQSPKEDTASPTNQQRLTRLGTFLGSGIFQNFSGTEDRLEITSGEQISEAGRETYRAEYKLTDKLSLTGEYDQYDDYNAGISYRIYTKEGTKREERKK